MIKHATIKEISEGREFDLRFKKTNVYKGYEGVDNKRLIFSYPDNDDDLELSIIHHQFRMTGLSTHVDLGLPKLFYQYGIFDFNINGNSNVMIDEDTIRLILFPQFTYNNYVEHDLEVASAELPNGMINYMHDEGALSLQLHIERRVNNISARIIVIYDSNYFFIEMLDHHQNI